MAIFKKPFIIGSKQKFVHMTYIFSEKVIVIVDGNYFVFLDSAFSKVDRSVIPDYEKNNRLRKKRTEFSPEIFIVSS